MKILCVCHEGHTRSVACAFVLRQHGHEAIAIGSRTTSRRTQRMLTTWADRVVLTDTRIRFRPKDKCVLWDVGPDRWFKPPNTELLRLFREYLEEDRKLTATVPTVGSGN